MSARDSGRLSSDSQALSIRYRFDSTSDNLILVDEADEESLVLEFSEQVKLLAVLVKEHTDLAEAILKEVRK